MTQRLFVGLDVASLPEVVREVRDLTSTMVVERVPGMTTEPLSGLHVTVVFVGDVDDSMLDLVAESIGEVARYHAPVHLSFGEVGGFPDLKNAEVLYVKTLDHERALLGLREDVMRELTEVGLDLREATRFAYSPHVSLARLKDVSPEDTLNLAAKAVLKNRQPADRLKFVARGLSLYRSRRTPDRDEVVYDLLMTAPLGGDSK